MADKARMLERLAARLDLTEPERSALHETAAYFRATQSDGSSERSAPSRPSSANGAGAPEAIYGATAPLAAIPGRLARGRS